MAKRRSVKYPHSANDAKLDAHLQWMRSEMDKARIHNANRRLWERAYDGLAFQDDEASVEPWLRDLRINRLRTFVDLIVGALLQTTLFPRLSYLGDDISDISQIARLRDQQNRILMQNSGFHNHRPQALRDAAVTGDGWMYYGTKADPFRPGGLVVSAKHIRWNNVLCDTTNCAANGDIKDCRFVAHFCLVELDRFCEFYPAAKQEAEMLARGAPRGRNAAVDDLGLIVDEEWDWLDGGYNGYAPGDDAERRFVCYGRFYYFTAQGKLQMYPFLADRSLTEMTRLAAPTWPYSHNEFPFCRWVSAAYSNGLPYSNIADSKIGLERIMQYILRVMCAKVGGKSIIVNNRAIPRGNRGSDDVRVEDMMRDLALQSQQPIPIFYTQEPDGLQIINSQAEIQQMGEFLNSLIGLESISGSAMSRRMTGDTGTTPQSGVSQRNEYDRLLDSQRNLITLDELNMQRVGRINLALLDDFAAGDNPAMDIPLGYMDGNGVARMIPENLRPYKISLPNVARGKWGIAVETMRRNPHLTQENMHLLGEFVKSFAGNHHMTATLFLLMAREMDLKEGALPAITDVLLKQGVSVPDFLLTEEQREDKKKMMEGAEAAGQAQQQAAQKREGAEIDKIVSEIKKNLATADKEQATAAKTAAEVVGEEGLPPQTVAAAVNLDDPIAERHRQMEQELNALRQENNALRGNPPPAPGGGA